MLRFMKRTKHQVLISEVASTSACYTRLSCVIIKIIIIKIIIIIIIIIIIMIIINSLI